MNTSITWVECPRDAMQGWKHWIDTEKKIDYLNALLEVGFHTLDFGSFVSPKAIPQMQDTAQVLAALKPSATKLLAIVANLRGAETALQYERIQYLGYPFSVSPTFQQRNTSSTQQKSKEQIKIIQKLCADGGKVLVVYLSMGFGNPYGDDYSSDVLLYWADAFAQMNIKILSLADTVGVAQPADISFALNTLIPKYPEVQFGVHLHSAPHNWQGKLAAAFDAGCTRFDSALMGIGGCPMAADELVGNMDTQWLLQHFKEKGVHTGIDEEALFKSKSIAQKIFVADGVDA